MLPYNNKDITSIFNYSKQLINKCLRDFVPDADEHKGKGGLGYPSQAVQYAELLSSVAFDCNPGMLTLGNVLSKQSFEQNVRMSSTSQPSFIRW